MIKKMNIVISEIRRRLEPIVKLIQKLGKSYPTRKEELFSWFTVTKWESVKQSEKDKHSLTTAINVCQSIHLN